MKRKKVTAVSEGDKITTKVLATAGSEGALQLQAENKSAVAIWNLSVLIVPDEQFWFAQGIEINYGAQGDTTDLMTPPAPLPSGSDRSIPSNPVTSLWPTSETARPRSFPVRMASLPSSIVNVNFTPPPRHPIPESK